MPTLKLLTLHCNRTEDDFGPDETVVTVSGSRYHKFGPRSMNNGHDWDVNAEIPFRTRARVEVWDEDLGRWPDYHDKLGTHMVNASQAGEGQKEARFNAYGSDYVLTYEVLQ